MIETELSNFKKEFEKEILFFFETKLKTALKNEEFSKEMIEVVKEFTMRGGKRIRPALVYYGYKCFNNTNSSEIIKAGISMELIQSYLLIHDDIIDDDNFRRNLPTVHKIYESKYGKKYGKSLAILAGDMASHLAEESILKLNIIDSKKISALKILNEAVQKVIYGQELDVLSCERKNFSKKDLFQIHNLKTSKYTFEGPLLMGATLGDANEADVQKLREYSYKMGIAFQLQDDILGLFGDQEKLGKPIGSDLKEGKKTLLILKAEETCSNSDKKFINSILGKKEITNSEIKKIREIVEKSGSLEYSKKMIIEFTSDAKTIIEKSKFNKEGKEFLINLADYLVKREN